MLYVCKLHIQAEWIEIEWNWMKFKIEISYTMDQHLYRRHHRFSSPREVKLQLVYHKTFTPHAILFSPNKLVY